MVFVFFFPLYVLGATGLDLHIKIGSKMLCFTHIPAVPQCVQCRGKSFSFPVLGVAQLGKASSGETEER